MYTISWHRENRVLYMKVEGAVAPDELAKMEDEAFEIIKNANQVIHAIVDLRLLDNPNSLNAAFGKGNHGRHPNQGISVIVVPPKNRVSQFIASTVMQIMRLQFRMCNSIEEAEAIIDKMDVRTNQA